MMTNTKNPMIADGDFLLQLIRFAGDTLAKNIELEAMIQRFAHRESRDKNTIETHLGEILRLHTRIEELKAAIASAHLVVSGVGGGIGGWSSAPNNGSQEPAQGRGGGGGQAIWPDGFIIVKGDPVWDGPSSVSDSGPNNNVCRGTGQPSDEPAKERERPE